MSTSIGDIVREATREKVDYLEAKFRADDDRRRADKNQARDERERTRERRLTKPGASPLAPKRLAPLEPGRRPTMAEKRECAPRFQAVYEDYGRKIAAAVSDRAAVRSLAGEAIEAVRRIAPLTHPDDDAIFAELERVAVAHRERLERETLEIDPQKIRTRGASVEGE